MPSVCERRRLVADVLAEHHDPVDRCHGVDEGGVESLDHRELGHQACRTASSAASMAGAAGPIRGSRVCEHVIEQSERRRVRHLEHDLRSLVRSSAAHAKASSSMAWPTDPSVRGGPGSGASGSRAFHTVTSDSSRYRVGSSEVVWGPYDR